MKKFLSLILLVIFSIHPIFGFDHFGLPWPQFPVEFEINPTDGPANNEQAYRDAFATWENTSGTPIRFNLIQNFATPAYQLGANRVTDGTNIVTWADFGETVTLGETTLWGNGFEIAEADMALNNNSGIQWTTDPGSSPGVDIETVALHEAGHSLGLGHSSDINAIMYFQYQGLRRSLSADDVAGIQDLYPGGAGTNQPPILSVPPFVQGIENEPIAFAISGSDLDEDPLTYGLISALPDNAVFPAPGTDNRFEWTPAFDQAGFYAITFYVNDGLATDVATTLIEVLNVNQPPVWFTSEDLISVIAGAQIDIELRCADPDLVGGLPQDVTIATTFTGPRTPEGLTIEPQAFENPFTVQRIRWQTSGRQVGALRLTATATDTEGAFSRINIPIHIIADNVPPAPPRVFRIRN